MFLRCATVFLFALPSLEGLSTSNFPSTGRRDFLGFSTFSAAAVVCAPPSIAAAPEKNADAKLLISTAAELKAALADPSKLEDQIFADGDGTKPPTWDRPFPSQVPRVSLQSLQKYAHDVVSDDFGGDGVFPAEDFLAVASEYAEHAGAARDLYKLSKLGRVGENGSEEVARDYAKRCIGELQLASPLLAAMAASIQ
jgi:hypothetical protein